MIPARGFISAVSTFALLSVSLLIPSISSGETTLNLGDAIDGLKAVTRQADPAKVPLDINRDGKIGVEEVVFILQYLAGNREISESTFAGITVSGNIQDDQTSPVSLSGILVEVNADLNEDGTYNGGELFSDITDANGFFSIFIPTGPSAITKMTMQTRGAGYSTYFKSFENVQESFQSDITLAGGAFFEIDVAGIPSGPARAGRVSLITDQEVNLSLTRDRVTGRTSGRAGLGRFAAPPTGVDGEVLSVSFPLRALTLPAGSSKIYANVAYLDTANNTETMPGSFMAEAEGETPKDVLQTYAASMINVSDENGNDLMTDPFDYSKEVNIKIALPPEVYDTIVDEVPDSDEKIEMPLYFFDEAEEIWKLHRDANGDPVYGWLVDNFGNVLNQDDLLKLQTIYVDAGGNYTGTAYLPAGVTSSDDVSIFQIGTVNHFTTWNCDRAGRSTSMNFDLVGPDGKPRKPPIRFRKKLGGRSSDKCTPNNRSGKCNTHTNRDAQADSIMKKLLGKDKAERERFLRWVVNNSDPEIIQALFDAMWRYSNEKRGEWNDTNEIRNGLRAIFSNKLLTDSIGATVDRIDCRQAPALCKGALAQAAEQVGKASDAKKAVAFLMQIGVEAYNPANLTDTDYVLDKGIGMIELAINTGSKSGELGTEMKTWLDDAKDARDKIKGLYNEWGHPPSILTDRTNWEKFRNQTVRLREALGNIKDLATTLGRRLNRNSLPRVAAQVALPETESELADLQQEITWDYKDIGGMFYGSHKFEQWQWGYYQGDRFIQTAPPAGLAGGAEVGVWEYYNGSAWVPLPGRSSQGVDGSHIPVPNVLSFGAGSPSSPVAYLGKWVIDTKPNVKISGRMVDSDGVPYTNASRVPVNVGSTVLYAGPSGSFSGTVSLYQDIVQVAIPGTYRQSKPVANNRIDIGDIVLKDKVVFNSTDNNIVAARNTPITIDAGAFALSGAPISYAFKLRKNYWNADGDLEEENSTGIFNLPGFGAVGYYYVDVTATADKDLGDGSKPFAKRTFQIRINNQPPKINSINLPPGSLTVGDVFTLTLDVTDDDSVPNANPELAYNDISSQYINIYCKDDTRGYYTYLGTQQNSDENGNLSWTVRAQNSRLYQIPAETITCTARAYVYDKAWGSDYLESNFTLSQNHVAPTIGANYINESYAATSPINLWPGSIYFSDLNNDITSYELDCGKGDDVITSTQPIRDVDPNTDGRQGCFYDGPLMDNGQVIPYNFTYKATDSRGDSITAVAAVTIFGPINMTVTYPNDLTVTAPDETRPDNVTVNDTDFDIVELPSGTNRSFSLGISATTPNGDNSLTSFNYTVRYQPANRYWWSTLASGDANVDGAGSIDVEISKPGQYFVFTNATDNAGVRAGFNKTFYVTSDFDFEQTINGATVDQAPAWFLSTDTITFDDQLTDSPDGFSAAYQWDIDYDNDETYTDEGTGSSLQKSLSAGTHTVRLTLSNAADSQQPAVVKETTVTVYEPLNLSLGTTYSPPVDTAVAAGDKITYSIANIPAGVNLRRAYWRVTDNAGLPVDGKFTVTNATTLGSRTFVFLVAGNYIVNVYAVDDRGLTGSANTGSFTVTDYVPTIDSLTINTSIGPPPLAVSLASTASDANGTVDNYIWQVTGQTTNGQITNINETYVQNTANTTSPQNFVYTFNSLGNYRITLIVEDNSGRKSAPSFKDINVLYRPPVIARLTADPSNGEAPLATTLTATASDVDGTITDYSWDIGADGAIEQSGTQNTFSHTFSTAGTYLVKLTVTDNQNLTATRSLNIYVIEVGQGAQFHFRELWADGLGQDLDFNSYEETMHPGEGAPSVVLIGPDSPIDAPQYDGLLEITGNTIKPQTATISVLPGYNGSFIAGWSGPELDLINIKSGGTYDVGLTPPIGFMNAPTLQVTFPSQYVCGTLFINGQGRGFGVDWEGNPVSLATPGQYPDNIWLSPWDNIYMNSQGEAGILAQLGTEISNGKCVTSLSSYTNATVWPDTDPENPLTIDISNSTTLNSKTLVLPAGFEFNHVIATLNGIRVKLNEYSLQSFTNGNIPIPIIPGADYEFEFFSQTDSGSTTVNRTVTWKVSAAQIDSSATIEPDFSALTSLTVTLTNMPSTVGRLWFEAQGNNMSIRSARSMSGSETSLSGILSFNDADYIQISSFDSNGQLLQSRRFPIADFTNSVDFTNTLAPDITLANPGISVDTTAKTLTLTYDSQEAACIVNLDVNMNNGSRERIYNLFTDGAAGSTGLTFSYPIPDMPDPYSSEPQDGTDVLTSAGATIHCFNSTVSYDELIRNLLANINNGSLRDNNWYLWGRTWWATDQLRTVSIQFLKAPGVNIDTGTYSTAQSVYPSPDWDAVKTTYTLDGTDPTINSTEYTSGTLQVDGNHGDVKTLKIASFDSAGTRGLIKTATYTFDKQGPAAPTLDNDTGTYSTQPVLVRPTLAEDAVSTYYVINPCSDNGYDPGTWSTAYTPENPISIVQSCGDMILKIVSFDALGNKGTVKTATYTFSGPS